MSHAQRQADETLAAQAVLADLSSDSPWTRHVAQALLGYGPEHVRLWMRDVNQLAAVATSYTVSADMTDLVRHAAVPQRAAPLDPQTPRPGPG